MRLPATRRMRVAGAALLIAVAGVALHTGPARAAGTSTISGTVFQDLNRNGVQDAGEAGFSSQGLALYNSSGTAISTAWTDANGNYSFTGLADGSYTVAFLSSYWANLRDGWVMTAYGAPAAGYLKFQVGVSLSGSVTANFALRQISRSTSISAPMSSYTTAGGTVIDSYDDVVSAQQLATVLATGSLLGREQPLTTVYFDIGTNTDTYTSVSGGQGAYTNYSAQVWLRYDDWATSLDETFFHEWGHAWSLYYAYMVQQDSTLAGYLQERGLTGNSNLGSSHMWEPTEMIAEDYRQLFGSANAASYAQENYQIPPAAQVTGLKSWLQSTFTQAPSGSTTGTPPSPSVSSVSPATGPTSGGSTVTVNGSGFSGSGWNVTGISFGGVAASSWTVVSSSQLSVVAPAGSGQVGVTVSSSDGSSTAVTGAGSSDVYTYAPVPTVSGISPATGTYHGGTAVTVTGTGFSGPGYAVTQVWFGSTPASSFTVVSATQITAVSPAGARGATVDVTVTSSGGTSRTCSADRFSYTRK